MNIKNNNSINKNLSPTGTQMRLVHKPTMYSYRNIYTSLFFFYLHSDVRFCFTFAMMLKPRREALILSVINVEKHWIK